MNVLDKIFSKNELETIKNNFLDVNMEIYSLDTLKSRPCYIYGAGIIGYDLLQKCSCHGFNIKGFVDKCVSKKSKIFIIPIYSLEDIEKNSIVIVAGRYALEMLRSCINYKLCAIFPRQLPGEDIITHCTMPETVNEVESESAWLDLYNCLADEESRQVLKNVLAYRLTLSQTYFSEYANHINDQYFHPTLSSLIDYRLFFDAGAYIGDTYNRWKNYCKSKYMISELKYIGVEADSENFTKLSSLVSNEISIKLYKNVISNVSNKSYEANISGTSTFFSYKEGNSEKFIKSITVDDITRHNPITALKADIEGSELELLKGSNQTLSQYKPSIFLSIYHRKCDIFKIPLYIRDLNLGYRIFLRHHSDSYPETVCYAI